MKAIFCLLALMVSVLLTSCKNTQKSGYEDPYVSNFGSNDGGGYNPYPSGGGQTSYAKPSTQSYEAPPVADDYAFNSSPSSSSNSAASTPRTTTSSSSATRRPATTTTKKPTTTASRPTASSRSHTVVRGDTLYSLSRKYSTTVAKIKSANALSSDLIRLGQKLKIP